MPFCIALWCLTNTTIFDVFSTKCRHLCSLVTNMFVIFTQHTIPDIYLAKCHLNSLSFVVDSRHITQLAIMAPRKSMLQWYIGVCVRVYVPAYVRTCVTVTHHIYEWVVTMHDEWTSEWSKWVNITDVSLPSNKCDTEISHNTTRISKNFHNFFAIHIRLTYPKQLKSWCNIFQINIDMTCIDTVQRHINIWCMRSVTVIWKNINPTTLCWFWPTGLSRV